MGIQTDLNIAPYYDDFDPSKNYVRVLFKPSVAVQARELTQWGSILQDQIEQFGSNVLKEGTIISGCNFFEVRNLAYVKILDLQSDGQPVVMSQYTDARAVGLTTGVTAKIVKVDTGLESQTPDLNTLYIKYLTTGSGGEKVFADGENIRIENFDTAAVITTVTAAGPVDGSPVGKSYGVRVDEGVIYQRGTFIRVDPHLTIVEKYGNAPDGVVVGFQTTETIVTSNVDTSLLDNAIGSPNENAPGADRLKLTATVVKLTLAQAAATEEFFAIQEYSKGYVVRRNRTTQYNVINDEMARRTYEESGNYVVRPFPVRVENHASNTDLLSLYVGAGLGYVAGKRVELLGDLRVDVNKASTSNTETSQSTAMNYGHYIICDEMIGSFDFDKMVEVTLHDTAQNRFTAGAVGTLPSGQIGTANIRMITHHSGDVGSATTQYRLYLFNIKMSSGYRFSDVECVFYNGSNKGCADVVLDGGNAVIREYNFKRALFEIGHDAVKTIPTATTEYIYREVDDTVSIAATTGIANITLSGDDEWPYSGTLNDTQKQEIVLIANATQSPFTKGKAIDLSGNNAVVSVAGSTMTIDLASAAASSVDAIVYYNVRRTQAAPAGKTANTVYVKIQANTHTNTTSGPYSLGITDAFEILGVWKSSSNTYSESEPEVTQYFTLNTGQRDAYYGLSEIKKKRALTIGANDVLLVKARVFKKDTSGSYAEGFFTVDSYPIDDANTANTAAITTQEIPVYKSESGSLYDLRNTIDFRPQVANTAAYAQTIGTANTNPASTLAFAATDVFFGAPNEQFEMDYQYYLGRKDKFVIDDNGAFVLIEGEPAEKPYAPASPSLGMTVVDLNIPPYPSLPKRDADLVGRPEQGVTMSRRDIKRYTMRDIGEFDRRIEALEYYTSLNSLEQAADSALIVDSTGNNRFKHGIFADNFSTLSLADVGGGEFSAGIDSAKGEIVPRFRSYFLDLKPATSVASSNVVNNSNTAITLAFDAESFITQPAATRYRSCTTDFYSYKGVMQIHPEYDGGADTVVAPDVNIDIDMVTPFVEFVDTLSEFVPLTTETVDETRTTVGRDTTITTTTTTTELAVRGDNNVQQVGDFVTNATFNPFLRSRVIKIVVDGLRPSTDFHIYFDGTNVDQYSAPADWESGVETVKTVRRTGAWGDTVSSDSSGQLIAVFRIPESTFYVGDRLLEILDVDSYASREAATSSAASTYHGFNFALERTGLSITTRTPQFSVDTTVSQTSRTETSGGGFPWWALLFFFLDPIAQTFSIRSNHSNDSVVMVPQIDLFFKQKSLVHGVTVQLREVTNGYPSSKVIPFGSVHLDSADVSVSDDGQTATTVTFPVPVALRTGQEYCFVVLPDRNDPDYLIWSSKTGERDVYSDFAVNQDFSDGVLFTSTNNSAWTAVQGENIKFTLYKAAFTSASGSSYLTNKDTEMLTVNSVSGSFVSGELVGVEGANAQGTVAVSAGNTTIVGSNTLFSSIYSVGDAIVVRPTANTYEVLTVAAIASNTSMTVTSAPAVSNAAANFFTSPIGEVTYFNSNEPARLFLDNSTARTGNVFTANDAVFGSVSGASATIETVDNQNVSHMQPNIYRTSFMKTGVALSGYRLHDGTTTYSDAMTFNNTKYFVKKATVIKSRSNEIVDDAGAKSFILKLALTNSATDGEYDSSPVIDHDISNVCIFENLINNDSTDETTSDGAATTKYVSRVVELADNLDAEDIRLYVTGYRPPGSDIKAYVRFQHAADSRSFDQVEWTEVTLKGETDQYSSTANRDDFREFEFNVPSGNSSYGSAGSGAWINTDNGDGDILRYIDPDGAIYDTYKYFAIKLVMLSSAHNNVPRLADVRAIALSA